MQRHRLDARHLLCPLPVIRLQDRVPGMSPGDEIEVICTDPGVMQDIPSWCRVHGHTVLVCEEQADEIRVLVRIEETSK